MYIEFTSEQFQVAFRDLSRLCYPSVLYPVVEFETEQNIQYAIQNRITLLPYIYDKNNKTKYTHIFVSLNRYERKKCIALAIMSLEQLRNNLNDINKNKNNDNIRILLVIAGGYDEVVKENVEYLQELKQLAINFKFNINIHENKLDINFEDNQKQSTNIECDVVFRTSISLLERVSLLIHATGISNIII